MDEQTKADSPVRIPSDLLERAEALIPWLETDDDLRLVGRGVSVAAVIRMAVHRGLATLEAEQKAAD